MSLLETTERSAQATEITIIVRNRTTLVSISMNGVFLAESFTHCCASVLDWSTFKRLSFGTSMSNSTTSKHFIPRRTPPTNSMLVNVDLMKRDLKGLRSMISWGSLDSRRRDTKHWALRIRGRYYHLDPVGKASQLALGPTYPPDLEKYSHSDTVGSTSLSDTEIQQISKVLL